jgi:O-antigen ligase
MMPWLMATVLIICAALYSLSRSAVLTSVIGILVMMMFWPLRRSVITIAVLGVAAAAVGLSGLGVVDALISSVEGASNDLSLESRATGLKYVLAHFHENPWFGQGVGTYVNNFGPVLDNQYLRYLIELGFCGLTAALLLTIAPLVLAFRVRSLVDQQTRDLIGGVAGSLVIVALTQALLDTSAFLQFSTLTALGLGILGALITPALQHQG